MEVAKTRPAISGDWSVPALRVTTILWLVLAIAICLNLLLNLVQQSFFFDGLIYASIARNISEGVGSVWAPQFSKTLFPVFAEHPPMAMWLESVVFRLFGDSVVVDKLFSLACFVVSSVVVVMTWYRLNGGDIDMRRGAPVVLTFAVVSGRFAWGFANGMLENLLIVFTSLAVFFVIVAYDDQGPVRRLCLVVGAGLLTALALMTKGPVGLFPLATPGIYWVSFRRPNLLAALVDTLVIGAVVFGVFVFLWTMEGPRGAIERYISVQLLTSFSGERGHNGAGLAAFRTFIRVNAYPLAVTAVVLLLGRLVQKPTFEIGLNHGRLRRVLFYSFTGFSASLPLLVSPRVSSFYFNPSLPYFSAALAITCVPVLNSMLITLSDRCLQWVQRVFAAILAASVLVVIFHIGLPGRDRATIENAEKIASRVCTSVSRCGVVVSTCGSVYENSALHAYLQRYFQIALADPATPPGDYLLTSGDCAIDVGAYRDVGANVAPYRLLQRE